MDPMRNFRIVTEIAQIKAQLAALERMVPILTPEEGRQIAKELGMKVEEPKDTDSVHDVYWAIQKAMENPGKEFTCVDYPYKPNIMFFQNDRFFDGTANAYAFTEYERNLKTWRMMH